MVTTWKSNTTFSTSLLQGNRVPQSAVVKTPRWKLSIPVCFVGTLDSIVPFLTGAAHTCYYIVDKDVFLRVDAVGYALQEENGEDLRLFISKNAVRRS